MQLPYRLLIPDLIERTVQTLQGDRTSYSYRHQVVSSLNLSPHQEYLQMKRIFDIQKHPNTKKTGQIHYKWIFALSTTK